MQRTEREKGLVCVSESSQRHLSLIKRISQLGFGTKTISIKERVYQLIGINYGINLHQIPVNPN